MITTLLIVTSIVYIFLIIFLCMGLGKSSRTNKTKGNEPQVSIIIAARNEDHCLGKCLQSLVRLDYPREKLEIIIVNDNSTDRTKEIAQSFVDSHPFMKMLTTKQGEGNLRGKTNALAQGIDASSGEILMFTDADCTVPRQWVREIVKYFDENTGIVGGFTFLEARRSFEGMQSLDWIFLLGLASSTIGWKIPLTAIGNNLSVRRQAYDKTGGYKHIPFSVTEDYSLVQAIIQKTSFEMKFPIDSRTLVKSKACQNWKQLYRQKQRWGVGGLDMILRGFIIMIIGWTFRISLLAGFFAASPSIIIAAMVSMSVVDLCFIWSPLKRFGSLIYLKYFIVFEIYFSFYVLTIPFVALLSKKIVWKERTL